MKFTLFFFFVFLLFTGTSISQPVTTSASDILQQLEKLNTLGSVLYIAAHPDDENTRLLTYLSKERKLRTGYLSLTRGDGGQNLIGKEQGETLGVLRTQELLAARRTDGAQQFFTRANDFGYSKTADETMSIWIKDSVLSDIVLIIRRFKPDVIICRFPTTGEGGHGHHTASAILALEAFEAAGDKSKFPHHLNETEVWKPEYIFWNTFNFGTTNTTSADQLKIDVGLYDPVIGKSYGEIAAESRSMHKSQGFGSARTRGTSIEYFKQLKGDSVKTDLFEDIDVSWKRLSKTESIEKTINDLIKKFQPQDPQLLIPDLIKLQKQIQQIPGISGDAEFWKNIKTEEINDLIIKCAGIWCEATSNDFTGIPGKPIELSVQAIARTTDHVKLKGISFSGISDTSMSLNMKQNELFTIKRSVIIPEETELSGPYWLKAPHPPGLYTVTRQALIGTPENKPEIYVTYSLEINGYPISIERPVLFKSIDPVEGEEYRPLEILPPATLNVNEKVLVFTSSEPKKIQFFVKANTNDVAGVLLFSVPSGWKANKIVHPFFLKEKNHELIVEIEISANNILGSDKLKAHLEINGEKYAASIQRIEYDHIPQQVILGEAETKLIRMDLKTGDKRVGFIPGAGDEVASCLIQAGYKVSVLTDELLMSEDLKKYDAIISGIRAFNVNENLQYTHPKLMTFVMGGGNLIIQYNTNNRLGPLMARISPYPFTISRQRVTDEMAEMKIINPLAPEVSTPNKITADDFTGWVQERGIYFATDLDSNYRTVFLAHDPGEKDLDGSLIIAKYGKGNFVYTGLAFFRQLPAGVPGAYKLMSNLIELPKND